MSTKPTTRAGDDGSSPRLTPVTIPGAENLDRIQRYGKYFLIRKLAEGGMAEIFLAKQVGAEGFERNVVIKRMLKHLSEEPSFVSMFLDEARLAARLAHQNIVQIHDLGLADGCYFICMEYLAGEDFSTVLRSAGRRREYVPINLVLKVMADAAHGLHFAHEFTDESGTPLRIVHRDVSPSNLYVTYQGQVKVLDFGIARAESRSTRTTAGVVKGKYMYMSPEQARSDPNHPVDRRADVFSLGVSLFEALTNVRPFAKDNDLAILNAVLRGEFKPPRAYRPDLPAEIEQIVLRAMALEPDERYQTAAEFAQDLERYLGTRTSQGGGTHATAYLKSLFGDERITHKTRIPTLDSLIQSGRTVAGFTDPEVKTVASIGARAEVAEQPSKQRKLPVLAAAIGGVLLASAVAGVVSWAREDANRDAPRDPPAQVSERVAVVPPPVVAADPDAGVAAAQQEAGAAVAEPEPPEPPPAGEPSKSKARKPIKLTVAEITRVVNRGRGPIMKCFDAHKSDLSTDEGQVTVQFTILSTGKVTGAKVGGPLAAANVGKCLERRVAKLRFPAHVDKEVTLGLPFAYRVQR